MEFAHAGRPSFVLRYYYNAGPPRLFSITNKSIWLPVALSYVYLARPPTPPQSNSSQFYNDRSSDLSLLLFVCACTASSYWEGTHSFKRELSCQYFRYLLVHIPIFISCHEHESHYVEISKQLDFQATVYPDKFL